MSKLSLFTHNLSVFIIKNFEKHPHRNVKFVKNILKNPVFNHFWLKLAKNEKHPFPRAGPLSRHLIDS